MILKRFSGCLLKCVCLKIMIAFSALDGSLRFVLYSSLSCYVSCFVCLMNYDRNGPLLVVASGTDTISVASSIRRLAKENVFVIQVKSLF